MVTQKEHPHTTCCPQVIDKILTLTQQRQLLRVHVNLGHPPNGEFCRALRNGRRRRGVVCWVKRYFRCPSEAHPMAHARLAAALLPECNRLSQVCGLDTLDVKKPLDGENPMEVSHVICLGASCHQGERRRDMSAEETFVPLRRFLLKHFDALEVSIMDQRTEFASAFEGIVQHRGVVALVRDLETLW